MMKTWVKTQVIICLLFCAPMLFSQSAAPVKKKDIRKANRLYLDYGFRKALPLFLKALDKHPDNFTINYRTGICYYYLPSEKFKCLKYLEKAGDLMGKDTIPELYLYLASAYHRENKFKNALENYKIFTAFLQDETEKKEIQRKMEMCRSGLEMMKYPEDIQLINLGTNVNSVYPDYAPVISPDNKLLIFTSKREGSTGGRMTEDDYYYFEDVYFSKRLGKDQWKASEKLDTAITRRRWLFGGVEYEQAQNAKTINTKDHDASISMSQDGKILFLYRKEDLWMADRVGDGWGKPRLMSPGINTLAHEPSLTLSFDQKTLFLVSERKGGFGGKDIYMTTLVNDTGWTAVQNLGDNINTPYDEESPFLMPDSKTLYFSSQGHTSIGGFDVFKSVYINGNWSAPRNLGFPLNSGTDDIFFIVNPDTSLGHFTTERKEGRGDLDVYAVSFIPTYARVQFLVYDNNSKQLIISGFRIKGEFNQDTLIKTTASPESISLAKVYNGKEYSVFLQWEGFSNKTVPLSLPRIRGKEKMMVFVELSPITGKKNDTIGTRATFIEVLKDVPPATVLSLLDTAVVSHADKIKAMLADVDTGLLRIYTQDVYKDTTPIVIPVLAVTKSLPGKEIIFSPVYFRFAKSALSDEAKTELDKLYEYLISNATARVSVEGYTDSKGSGSLNKKLSYKRANAVAVYLKNKGIPDKQLDVKGYGEENPVSPNENPDGSDNFDGRLKNRRVEIKLNK